MDFGWYGDRDIGAAVSYLLTRPDVDASRIAAVGLSMGGEEAVGAAGGDPRVRAVVGEGVTNRAYADKAGISVGDTVEWRIVSGDEMNVAFSAGDDSQILAALNDPPDYSAFVSTDPRRLERILGNLLANAARYGRPPIQVDTMPSPTQLQSTQSP